MRIAYFGGDWFMGCISVLQACGHEICHIFTDGEEVYNQDIRRWAVAAKVPQSGIKPGTIQMQKLMNERIDLLFSVEYPWKIPCEDYPFKTLNVHPSLLPHGRGPNPISWSLLKYPQHAGITFHKLASEFDTGDIVSQKQMSIKHNDDLDSYLQRLENEIPELLFALCKNFDDLYDNATPQTEGSYWPKLSLDDRKLTWSMSIVDMQKIIRASGKFGVVVIIDQWILLVRGVECLAHKSEHQAGTLFKEDDTDYYIAALDGICRIPKGGILERTKLEQ